MSHIMLSWIGGTDHEAANGKGDKQPGPIARMVDDKRFSDFTRIHLLNSYPNKSAANFKRWLGKRTKAKITTRERRRVRVAQERGHKTSW